MPKILYTQVIKEDPRELEKIEKHHRYTHLFQRVRMLRLLASVPEVVCLLQVRWFGRVAQKQGGRTRSPGVGHTRSFRGAPRSHEEGRDSHHLSGSSVPERAWHRVLSPRGRRTASQAPQGKAQDGTSSA